MDTLTHALSGALAARLIARRPTPSPTSSQAHAHPGSHPGSPSRSTSAIPPVWQTVAVGTVAATFPDLDFVLGFISELAYLRGHRGPTHSFILLPLWALLIAWLMARLFSAMTGWSRRRASMVANSTTPLTTADTGVRWQTFYLVACTGLFVHIIGDLITQFGTMVLSPVSDHRFEWGITFIIDLGVSGILLAGLILSAIWRHSRLPAALASLALVGWLTLSATAKQDAIAAAHAYAEREGIKVVSVSASPRPASPFNWTAIVFDGDRYHFAHLNTRRSEILTATESDHFIRRFSAHYLPITQAQWITRAHFGDDPLAATLAREVWQAEEFAFYRWFAMFPVLDQIDDWEHAGIHPAAALASTNDPRHPSATPTIRPCVSFRDLRFETPGRGRAPFRYGLCDKGNGWQLFERVADGLRWIDPATPAP